MSTLTDDKHRTDLLNRLRRAEGQLRGLQRMIEEGQPCLDIVGQISAVRRALDSACVRMTVCYLQQELQSRLGLDRRKGAELGAELGAVLDDVQALLGKVK